MTTIAIAPTITLDFDALYRQHASEIRHFVVKMSSTIDPDDVVQDTFERAISAAGSFTLGSNARSWLFQIARNRVIDLQRREACIEMVPLEYVASDNLSMLEDRDDCIDQYAKLDERLTKSQQTILHMSAAGYNCREIAIMTKMNPNTIKHKMHRARKKLNRQDNQEEVA